MALTVFLCYADEDERMVSELKKQLKPLERNGLITIQDDGHINAGTDKEAEVKKHIEAAQIILLLISASFVGSDYHYRAHMQHAIQRHERKEAYVIPIILRATSWEEPPLSWLQPLPDRTKPVASWRPQDKGWKTVVDGIRQSINQWNEAKLPDPPPERKVMIAHLDKLIEAVRSHLQPVPRAEATAKTLQQLSLFIPPDVTLADLALGWRLLSQPLATDEDGAVKQRRVTCAELAQLASQLTNAPGEIGQAIKAWRQWSYAFQRSDDPRQVSMTKTFTRELLELEEKAQ